jgi:ketopantoate reductase
MGLLVIFKTHQRPKRFTPQNMGPYKTSTTVDFLERRPMEVKYLFRTPVERAEELGVPVPHLETMVLEIGPLQRMHNLF